MFFFVYKQENPFYLSLYWHWLFDLCLSVYFCSLALYPQASITSYTLLLHQSSDDMSLCLSFLIFLFTPVACPFDVSHPFLYNISIYHAMVSSSWLAFHLYTALFILAPSSFPSSLLPLLFFPLPCTSWSLHYLQHILTSYCLAFHCFCKVKNTHFHRHWFVFWTPHALKM